MVTVFNEGGVEVPAWEVTKDELYCFSDGQMKPLWQFAADRMRREAGSDDLETVVAHYQKEFGLPPITLIDCREVRSRIQGMPERQRKAGEMSYTLMQAIRTTNAQSGNTRYWISHNPRSSMMTEDQKLVVLMHEIEHIRDMVNGYEGGPEHPVEYDRVAREYRILPGHHQHFALFDYEWPHRMVIEQALEAGESIPDPVLAGYPDLAERAAELSQERSFRR
jgi:hypothetical protein